MKTIILKFIAVAVVLLSVITSCKKDKTEDPVTPSPTPTVVQKGTVTIDWKSVKLAPADAVDAEYVEVFAPATKVPVALLLAVFEYH